MACCDTPSVPSIPDPATTAAAQSGANVNTAAATSALNNMNMVTPYGSVTYDTTGTYTTPDGQVVPRYTATTALTPSGQAILKGTEDTALNLLPAADSLSRGAAYSLSNPLDFNTAGSKILYGDPTLLSDKAADATYAKAKGFLDPQWNQQQRQLEDQLSRQGIPIGSEAYSNAMTNFNNARTQAYDAASSGAIANGTNAAGNLFNMALSGHNQNLTDQRLAQNNPLDNLKSLFGSTPTTPSQPIAQPTPVNVAPTDVVGATNAANSAAMNVYNAGMNANNSMFGGLAGLGSSFLLGSRF